MTTIGERLKEERIRLELTQLEMAEKCNVGRQAQVRYEAGERSPDGNYFAAIANVGADVQYILTGKRTGDSISRLTANMVNLMDALNETQQREILRLVEEKKRLNELEAQLRNVS